MGSVDQHSGLVFMGVLDSDLSRLVSDAFEMTEAVCHLAAESHHIGMQPIPKERHAARLLDVGSQVQCQATMA